VVRYFAPAQPHPAAQRHPFLHPRRSPQVQRSTAIPGQPQVVFSHWQFFWLVSIDLLLSSVRPMRTIAEENAEHAGALHPSEEDART